MRIRRCWPFALLILLSSLAQANDIKWSSLMQKGKHHELIKEIQPRVDKGDKVTSFQFLLLASAYYEVRQYDKALATTDLMEKRIASGDDNYYGSDLSVFPQVYRAAVHLDQGQYEEAIKSASDAYGRLKQNQSFYRWQLIQISNILGVANAFLGRTDEAHKCIETIAGVNLAMSNLGPEKYIAMARIHTALKEYDEALKCVNDKHANVSFVLKMWYDPAFQDVPKFFIRCKSQYETGQVKEAKKGYDQLLKHPQITQLGGIYWPALYDRARIAQSEGNTAEAIEYLKKAVEVIEQQRSSIDTESGRIGFVGDKQAIYQLLVSLLLAEGRDGDAFEYVERAKARALVDLLASQKTITVRTAKPEAGDALAKLTKAEADLVAFAAPDDKTGGGQTRSVVLDLKGELQVQAPELASLVTVTSAPAKEIQDLLQPDEALLEYYYTDKDLAVFIMTKDGLKAVKLERAGLEENVNEFRAALINPASTDHTLLSQKLYNRLFQPVAGVVQAQKLIVVPHGVLHYLPFCALCSDKGFLIDSYSIRVEPSASVLKFLKGREKKAETRALVLGNPDLGDPKFDLKFAQEEATAIAKVMPGAKVLLRGEATKGFVKTQGDQFTVLHFATHGVFDLKEPLNSALLLAKDPDSDGRLRVGDLYTLKLDADLVTLSACETALGKVANGDDVVGFTRGLLYAGASSIVSSLWKVDDLATRDLMVDFYTNLPKLGKQESLRQAQLSVKKQHDHPFYWAAFVLTGNAQ